VRKLLSSKAMVVSVAAKGGIKSRQVWSGEASESKPSMTCRKFICDVTPTAVFVRFVRFGRGYGGSMKRMSKFQECCTTTPSLLAMCEAT
jgi:hypothetical protein